MRLKNNVIVGGDSGDTWYECACCTEWFRENTTDVRMSNNGDPYCSESCQNIKSPLLYEIDKLQEDMNEYD